MEHDVPFDPSLDLSAPRAPVPAPLRPRTQALASAVRILVIDDEPSFVSGLTQLLRRDGYTVDTAANGTAALTQLQAQCYDVLLCDLRMPDLDGPALYARLLHQYTSLSQRVIFLTGDTLSADSTAFLAQCAQPWLPKPCNAEAIRRAIQQVLQAVALRPARMEARKAFPMLPPAE